MRNFSGFTGKVFNLIAWAMGIYCLVTAVRPVHPIRQAAIAMGFALVSCFGLFPARKNRSPRGAPSPLDWVWMILSALTCGYMALNYEYFLLRPAFSTPIALAFGTILLLLILESARRAMGLIIPLMTLVFLLYTLFGDLVPGRWGHGGFSHARLIEFLYLGTRGYWGTITRVLSLELPVFILFGAILLATGGAEVFSDMAKLVAGRFSGGAAIIALLASAVFGTLSGSSVSNVATTGAFTIPMMKDLGYKRTFAGAVEAVASTGGQFMPPVMGAGAFIMAEIIGAPYIKVCLGAAIPAILFFFGVGFSITIEARRTGMGRIPKAMMPKAGEVLSFQRLAPVIIPVGVLLYFLIEFYTPRFAALWALISLVGLYLLFSVLSQRNVWERCRIIGKGLITGVRSLVVLLCIALCVQIIVSLIGLTGIGVKITTMIIDWGQERVFLSLVLSGLVAVILGMGLPTSAAYVLGASVLGAALMDLGIEPMAAHLFIFFFAILSVITPPLCPAVYVAAGLADADWKKTALSALRLAMPAYIIPYMFVFNPALIGEGTVTKTLFSAVAALFGVFFLSAGLIGYLKGRISCLRRVFFIAAGFILIHPGLFPALIR